MIFNIFKSKLKKGDVYAVQAGDFTGQLFNYIKEEPENYVFLSIPDMKIQKVPKEKFDFGVENDIIEYIETLPRNIFKVIKKQYEVLAEKEH